MSGKQLVIIKKAGNHSNRLIQNMHLEIWCKAHNIAFFNNDFSQMAGLYKSPPKRTPCLPLFLSNLLRVLFSKKKATAHTFNTREPNQGDQLLRLFERYQQVRIKGFCFRASELIQEYKKQIVDGYSLRPEILSKFPIVDQIIHAKKSKIIVGIHIRRGDYRSFKKGKYYYADDIYENFINQIRSNWPAYFPSKQIEFILFSNEKIGIAQASDIMISKNPWYIDQHVMGLCDYLLGPPSTFTYWASLMGSVPLKHMYSPNEQIERTSFVVAH